MSQPVRRIEVDAAILFSDLLLPLEPMGLPFDFVKGEGPHIERPIESSADIDKLKVFEPREALAQDRRLVVADPGETSDDLVQDMIDVLANFCVRTYGRRGARNRARAR